MANVDWDPDNYLASMLAEIPSYLDLQDRVAAATEGLDVRDALELGVGTARPLGASANGTPAQAGRRSTPTRRCSHAHVTRCRTPS